MGTKLSEIAEGANITLNINMKESDMKINAILKKVLRDDIALIELLYDSNQRLNFDNVLINMEYSPDDDVPLIWRNVKIAAYKTAYIMQSSSDGVRHNRRGCFRVSVARTAMFRKAGHTQSVMIKDISLSGFAISDQKKELGLAIGDLVSISFEDLGYQINLDGRAVRIEEREDMIIYGFEIRNLCKDLSSYISVKQRRNKKAEA